MHLSKVLNYMNLQRKSHLQVIMSGTVRGSSYMSACGKDQHSKSMSCPFSNQMINFPFISNTLSYGTK